MSQPPPANAPVPSGGGFIFVYGGLMRGFDLHHFLAGSTFVSLATARGKLYAIGRYPGMIAGEGTVRGELFEADDVAVVLEVLDEVEGYDPLDADASEYVRAQQAVRTDDGRDVSAWLYLYNGSVAGLDRIKGGDWRTT
jgi:gamma-glutamylcyclotransferase (GGCT)/AIG2-like uncharacterized protein YtfP